MDKKKKRLFMRSAILAVLAGLVVYALYTNLTKESRGSLEAGDKAPDFVLTDVNGETHQLSDYEGKGVFLNFWGTWCEPCKEEMPHMEKLANEFKGEVEILAVNVGESNFQVTNFAEQYGLTFPIAIDEGKEVMDTYGVDPLPTTFMIKPDGTIDQIVIGGLIEEEQVRALFERVKPSS
ncbi:thiol-disulfide oxidoreductase ResA [Domibacillus enclensis]|uniref:Peroxiredoxin n=1 Tax=Domibacillus enclensis TaxID=1017273 RepID=A0A1N6PBN5_9BACI|nr:thiol-disulfide oxidoreductase ResA [Domibacillus enclensis]OXS80309.1 thiol-disulfide oxidoreductase [Domibacillus enclensis]SIQ01780.1 Peroxiredoxin [Domibacillus enclensis]